MRTRILTALVIGLATNSAYAGSITVDIYTKRFDARKGGAFNEHQNGTMTLEDRTLTITPAGKGPSGKGKQNGAVRYDDQTNTQSVTRAGGWYLD